MFIEYSCLIADEPVENAVAESDALKYRALYQFDARNADEISFMPGDIITVKDSSLSFVVYHLRCLIEM